MAHHGATGKCRSLHSGFDAVMHGASSPVFRRPGNLCFGNNDRAGDSSPSTVINIPGTEHTSRVDVVSLHDTTAQHDQKDSSDSHVTSPPKFERHMASLGRDPLQPCPDCRIGSQIEST